ncbi:hypothetical protein LNA61_002018 [Staphylococcus pseudintermedius]|nr:hypothetical protein [Staphylococcus pseudintermedius]EIA5732149.1 hypothetical protein [Staphylococcus pseudintermedius]EIM5194547.1 hypothetical protein [Staphylococcus pseudintermedius]EMB9404529.1 hypothetical protein [Staphylococcus pseudintermedius]EMC0274566.1 hypothetical protein [Staphylococcus pseudintermedius]
MDNSKLLFSDHFYQLRRNPRWKLKLLLAFLTILTVSGVSVFGVDFNDVYKNAGINEEQLEMVKKLGIVLGITGGTVTSIINIIFIFVIVLIISKIMKADIRGVSIFSATLSFVLLTLIIKLIVLVIQLIVGVPINEYSITSLNIFDKGNELLSILDIQNIFASYLFGLIFYKTSGLSGKISFIVGAGYFLFIVILAILAGSIK